jgi:hypothetical protein
MELAKLETVTRTWFGFTTGSLVLAGWLALHEDVSPLGYMVTPCECKRCRGKRKAKPCTMTRGLWLAAGHVS